MGDRGFPLWGVVFFVLSTNRVSSLRGKWRGGYIWGPKKIIIKLHVTWGRAPANQPERVLADSESGNSHLVNFADGALEHCDACKAFEKAPHAPIAGTLRVSMFNEKVQVDLPFLGDLIALHAMDTFSRYSLLLPVQSKNPRGT